MQSTVSDAEVLPLPQQREVIFAQTFSQGRRSPEPTGYVDSDPLQSFIESQVFVCRVCVK